MSQSASVAEALKPVQPEERRLPRVVLGGLLIAAVVSIALVIGWDTLNAQLIGACTHYLGDFASPARCASGMSKVRTYSLALVFLPIALLIEHWRPANRNQPLFSPSLLVDSVWFVFFPVLGVALIASVEQLLSSTFVPALGDWRISALQSWPLPAQFLFVILLSDFLAWFSHWLRHHVSIFWEFHKIHHSQTHLNYFSATRLHPGDRLISALVRFLPFALLDLNLAVPAYLAWNTILRLWEMFVHSNIRWNLGPLVYLVVTPQSHRIHHSNMAEHSGLNLGNFFTIWDFMFGTQCRNFDIYPELGIDDQECPPGRATTLRGALKTFIDELIYPFRVLGRRWFRSGAATR